MTAATSRFASTYVDADVPSFEPGALAGALATELDRLNVGATVVAAVASRARLAALVAACLGTGRRVVFPHGFSSPVLESLADGPDAALVHDRDGGVGLDLRSIVADDARAIDLAHSLELARDREALVFMTSGTTGRPSPVPKNAAQVLDEARVLAETFGIEDGDVVALGVPSTHLFGFLFGVALPCVRAIAVHAPLVRYAKDLVPSPRWFVGAPPTIQSFVYGGDVPAGIGIVSSGAALDPSIGIAARRAGAGSVLEIFGSTETGGIGFRTASDVAYDAFPGTMVAESDGVSVVASPFTAGRSVALSDRLEILGRRFRFVERDADLVKVGGRRVSVGAIENAIRALPGVTDVAVRARPAPGARGSRLAALVVSDVSVDGFRAALGRVLDAEFVPRPIVRVPAIARSPSGKLPIDSFERQLESGLRTSRSGLGIRADRDGFEIRVAPEVGRFEGHFPGEPILPGVSVLLDLVLPMVHARFTDLGWPRRLTRVKFMRPIRPEDVLRCELVRKNVDQLAFEVTLLDGTKVGSGNLDFGATQVERRSQT